MAVNLTSSRLSTETRLLQVCKMALLQPRKERLQLCFFPWNLATLTLNSVPGQAFPEYSVTLWESLATTESCFQSLRKR